MRHAQAASSQAASCQAASNQADPDVDDDERDADPNLLGRADASEALFSYLVSMKMAHRPLTAKSVCTIAYLACKAGAEGAVEELALSPTSQGGHFSSHFDKVTGLAEQMQDRSMTTLMIPGNHCRSSGRTQLPYAANLVFDSLASEIASVPNFDSQLEEAYTMLGDLYTRHPRVLATPGTRYIPLAFYQDAVSFQWDKKDGALGVGIINLVTQARHLALVIRKKHICQCGCRGWCTYYVCYEYLAWLLSTMLRGQYPEEQFGGIPWGSHLLSDFAGQSLGYAALVVLIKADWMEFAAAMGFPNWMHHQHPCFLCSAKQGPSAATEEHIEYIDGVTPMGLPWDAKSSRSYAQACAACETRVHIADRRLFVRVMASLQADRRKRGSYGRRVMAAFPELGVKVGMRLEPGNDHRGVWLVDDWSTNWPAEGVHLSLWDVAWEDGTRHRNPIFGDDTGLMVEAAAVDELHTMHLGVIADYAAAALWQVILGDAMDVGSAIAIEDSYRLRCDRIQAELADWYARQRTARRSVNELVGSLFDAIGDHSDPKLHGKGAVNGDLLRFTVDLLGRYSKKMTNGAAWLGAGRALEQYLVVTRRAGHTLKVGERQSLIDGCLRFRRLAPVCGIRFKPKHHLYIHLVCSVHRFGNPRLTSSTWIDESLNSTLVHVAQSAHSLAWSRRIIAVFAHQRGPTAMASKRKRA